MKVWFTANSEGDTQSDSIQQLGLSGLYPAKVDRNRIESHCPSPLIFSPLEKREKQRKEKGQGGVFPSSKRKGTNDPA